MSDVKLDEIRIPTVNTIKYLLAPIIEKLDHIESTVKLNSPNKPKPKYYRNIDLKNDFGLSSNTIIKYRESGQLPFTKLGEIYLYEKKKIDSILIENSVNL